MVWGGYKLFWYDLCGVFTFIILMYCFFFVFKLMIIIGNARTFNIFLFISHLYLTCQMQTWLAFERPTMPNVCYYSQCDVRCLLYDRKEEEVVFAFESCWTACTVRRVRVDLLFPENTSQTECFFWILVNVNLTKKHREQFRRVNYVEILNLKTAWNTT